MSYQDKLPAILKRLQLAPGQVSNIEVKHDDWCALLNGRGVCDCDPEIIVNGIPAKN